MANEPHIAYLVGGPADGDLLAVRSPRLEVAVMPEIAWIVSGSDEVIDVSIRTVIYEPATVGGFLWYARG
jgi:hypothetical protein